MRHCGILLAISSLPSRYGIGTLGSEARRFVDYILQAGCDTWQMLPAGPIGFGDSPYQSFSSCAGNPYYIDLETLRGEGLLSDADMPEDAPGNVDYGWLYNTRFEVLRRAFANSYEDISAFEHKNAGWLDDYALFMALKGRRGVSWQEWPHGERMRESKALENARAELAHEIRFQKWMQYKFFTQWDALKSYANSKGVRFIGDVPIYVALDSADAWAHGEVLQLDENRRPRAVAGVPPDAFSATGQLWGNPLYDWEYLQGAGFSWWIERLKASARLFDVIRIDHFRGFAGYYSIPYGAKDATRGRWVKAPGRELFAALKKQQLGAEFIAEDLGVITPDVQRLLKYSGLPGMKVLQFAFDSEGGACYLPHNYDKNCVVYTGTHDNDTTNGWYASNKPEIKKFIREYSGARNSKEVCYALIKLAIASCADTAVIPMQDVLGLGHEARMNMPSTLGGNWQWRMTRGQFGAEAANKLRALNEFYQRAPRAASTGKNFEPPEL